MCVTPFPWKELYVEQMEGQKLRNYYHWLAPTYWITLATNPAIALDFSTLFIIATCVTALLGVFLLFAWVQDRVRALAWWGCAYLIGGFSVSIWSRLH